jgi:hypothetical protein
MPANDNAGHGASVIPVHEQLKKDVRKSLMILLGAVGFLLLIGCSNVASLLLARGATRRREVVWSENSIGMEANGFVHLT